MRLRKNIVILMAPFFGAGGPMQLCLQRLRRPGLHRSSGLQSAGHQDLHKALSYRRGFNPRSLKQVHRNQKLV